MRVRKHCLIARIAGSDITVSLSQLVAPKPFDMEDRLNATNSPTPL
jgi:hypothetical protein